ncbi:hypothetical protein ACFSTH_13340 [Paenibacillus yanchengensis]
MGDHKLNRFSLVEERDPERSAKILGRTPMGKSGKPEDIGL